MATLAPSSAREAISLAENQVEGVADCVVFATERSRSVRFGVLLTAIITGAAGAALVAGKAESSSPVSYLLFGLAFAGGLLSTWSPCGYSSLCLLRPTGRHSWRSLATYSSTMALHGLGYAAGAVILGAGLGFAGSLVGLSGLSAIAIALLGALGLVYGAHQLGFLRVPYPQRRAQVPHDARQRFPVWAIGGLYGFSLGLNYLTYVQTPILYVVTGAAALSGHVGFAIALVLTFNAGRFLPMLVNYLPVSDIDVQKWLARRQESAAMVDGALLAAAGTTLLVLAAF